ncbi:Dinitrogenase iron-molybdenum cofactor biosynthesis protein [Spirochaeta thermophila DSM 6578]|uniref:Dinitrogenase iron-molybdenum cofactor biosynthesis protein n=1 Tax=Winmispira thermophila (strain ATCC 700085 / DSM 6578 / Z-1203) TaxID=869211 RepID=G0GE91_WINT7|nr:NifB/NifX family molybdenum-iron cluster-binding protein [Spirochaeta thermophila]AEJ61444.1 Dinitrogenase iron-molybdenum cofactor biosynthesis protein [Spirochaeta thermophila DSM 6578]
MKIAVTARGAGLGAWLDPVFEEARQLLVVDESDRFTAWNTPPDSHDPEGEDRIRWLVDEGANVLVTGRCSEKTYRRLREAGIRVLRGDEGAVLQVVEAARRGELAPLDPGEEIR